MISILKAIVCSSSVVVLAYLALIILSGDLGNQLVFVTVIIAYICAVSGVIFVGVPTHLVLTKLGVKSSIPYLLIGLIVPSLLVWLLHPFGADGFYWIAWQGCLMGGFGVLTAYVFWKNAVDYK